MTTFELETKEERSRTYTNVFELLTGIIFILGAVLIILNRVYITYGCNENYLEAWKISPILMYSSILNCVSGLLGSNYLIMHDTKSALKVTAVGAFINTILNFILVPIYGVYGAALATIVGYLYMVVVSLLKLLELTDRFDPKNITLDGVEKIDFGKSKIILDREKKRAIEYIEGISK